MSIAADSFRKQSPPSESEALVDRICRAAGLLTPCCKSRLNHAAAINGGTVLEPKAFKFALPGICEVNDGSPLCGFVLRGSNFVVGDRDRRERTSADSANRPGVVCPTRRPGPMDQHSR